MVATFCFHPLLHLGEAQRLVGISLPITIYKKHNVTSNSILLHHILLKKQRQLCSNFAALIDRCSVKSFVDFPNFTTSHM